MDRVERSYRGRPSERAAVRVGGLRLAVLVEESGGGDSLRACTQEKGGRAERKRGLIGGAEGKAWFLACALAWYRGRLDWRRYLVSDSLAAQ